MMLFSWAPVSASIEAPERTSNNTWVEDYADVLSSSTEAYIQEYSQRLADEHSACIVVVTVDFVTGTMEDYALAIFNQWKIGDASLNNGVLLLLSIGDDDYYMMIGRGLEKSFSISKIQDLLDVYLEPDFANKDYDAGVKSVFAHTYDYMQYHIYGGSSSGGDDGGGSGSSYSAFSAFIGLIMVLIMFFLIIYLIRRMSTRTRYYQPTYYYTRPRTTTYYHSPYSYRPYSSRSYSTPSSSYRSSGGGGSSYRSSGGGGSYSSHSSGSGSSYGGSSRGAGAGRSR